MFSQPKRKSSFIKEWKYVYQYVYVHAYVDDVHVYVLWVVCIPDNTVYRLAMQETKTPHVFFLFTLLKPSRAQKGRGERDLGVWTKDSACWANCSWCETWPVWSWAFITTGSRQQARSVLWRHWKEMPVGMILKIDQMTCLFLGWCQNIQCFNLVITRCSSPSMTRWELRGEPVTARGKILKQLKQKIMTRQNKQGKWVTFNSYPGSLF